MIDSLANDPSCQSRQKKKNKEEEKQVKDPYFNDREF